MLDDLNQEQRNKLARIIVGVSVLLYLGLLGGAKYSETKALHKLEKRNEMRGQAFADYVFKDIETYVWENMPSQREINKDASSIYYDPKWQEEKIEYLVKDSTKYADAIVRDAPAVISGLDGTRIYEYSEYGRKKPKKKTFDETFRQTLKKHGDTYTSFESALRHVQSQQALRTGPEYRLEPHEIDDGEGGTIITGMDHIPTGRTIVKGANTSEDYKMKVNIRHLKNISKELAYARAVKAQAVRNAKTYGK